MNSYWRFFYYWHGGLKESKTQWFLLPAESRSRRTSHSQWIGDKENGIGAYVSFYAFYSVLFDFIEINWCMERIYLKYDLLDSWVWSYFICFIFFFAYFYIFFCFHFMINLKYIIIDNFSCHDYNEDILNIKKINRLNTKNWNSLKNYWKKQKT